TPAPVRSKPTTKAPKARQTGTAARPQPCREKRRAVGQRARSAHVSRSFYGGNSMSEAKEPWGNLVLVEFDDGIAWVTMNRPEKRNAMSPALNDEMLRTVTALATDDRCKVLVLTGAANRSRPAWISRNTSARPT